MKIWPRPFNSYLVFVMLALTLSGQGAEATKSKTAGESKPKTGDEQKKPADTKSHKKEASTFKLHLEASAADADHSQEVPLYRANPVMVRVEKAPLQIDEGNVVTAMVLDIEGGFLIKIQLDKRGTWLLENITLSNIGKRLAIRSQFGSDRWLAAPVINRRVSDGVLTFTPDANREESERFVRGLNNIAAKVQKKNKF